MSSLSQAKTLGGVGAILTLLLFVPDFVGAALVIIGWILIMIAVKYISDEVRDRSIFNNVAISVVMSIIGIAIFAVVVVGAVFGFLGLRGLASTTSSTPSSSIIGLVSAVIAGLVVVWILAIISSIFL